MVIETDESQITRAMPKQTNDENVAPPMTNGKCQQGASQNCPSTEINDDVIATTNPGEKLH